MSEDPYDKISEHYAEGLRKSMETCLTGFNTMMDNAKKLINEQAEERMNSDKELLELAAKAAGYTLEDHHDINGEYWPWCIEEGEYWCPLTDDGDALRLAVKLNLSMDLFDDAIFVGYTPNCNDCDQVREELNNDPYASTRRAIVKAAAEIGRSMG